MKAVKNTRRLWLGLRPANTQLDLVKIFFFYGKTYREHQIYDLDQANDILKHSGFDVRKKTVLYIHGYVESPGVESVRVIVDAYIKRGDHNILVLDWNELSDGNYLIDAVQNIKLLGPKLAEVIIGLFMEGLHTELFHLVGHSLGGQLSGLIGRTIIEKSEKATKISRISALDPAFPVFYPGIGATALSDKDANFVDVIHTDAWLYGAPVSTGTVDFWPNSGKTLQPGCPKRNYKLLSDNDLCSHRRSWWFWAESVAAKNTASFHSIKAKSWDDFKKGRTDDSAILRMGIDCVPNAKKGDYFLQTNAEPPYSKGIGGITFEDE